MIGLLMLLNKIYFVGKTLKNSAEFKMELVYAPLSQNNGFFLVDWRNWALSPILFV
jgi:hypothetical protein